MIYYRYLIMFFLIVSCSSGQETPYVNYPFVELLVNKKLGGKKIIISAYMKPISGSDYLFLTKDHADMNDFSSAIRMQAREKSEQYIDCESRYVKAFGVLVDNDSYVIDAFKIYDYGKQQYCFQTTMEKSD